MAKHSRNDCYLEAELWHCEDEICDCWQPIVTLRTPNNLCKVSWCFSGVAEGSYCSNPSCDEADMQRQELTKLMAKYAIPECGYRRATVTEIDQYISDVARCRYDGALEDKDE